MEAFPATAEIVIKMQCSNHIVRSVIAGKQLISERDQVDASIAENF